MAWELQRLDDLPRKVRLGIADLGLSRERVQAQITALEQQEAKLAEQAAKAQQMGREDLSQVALARQQEAEGHRAGLVVQLDQVKAEEAKLIISAQRLQTKKAIRQFGLDDRDGENPSDSGGRP